MRPEEQAKLQEMGSNHYRKLWRKMKTSQSSKNQVDAWEAWLIKYTFVRFSLNGDFDWFDRLQSFQG
jgi:hypothetical protein